MSADVRGLSAIHYFRGKGLRQAGIQPIKRFHSTASTRYPITRPKQVKIDASFVYSVPTFADVIARTARKVLASPPALRSESAQAFFALDAHLRAFHYKEIRPPDTSFADLAMVALQALGEQGVMVIFPMDWTEVTYRIRRYSGENGIQQVLAVLAFVQMLYPQLIVQERS